MSWENVYKHNILHCFIHTGFSKENWENIGSNENEELYELESDEDFTPCCSVVGKFRKSRCLKAINANKLL